MSETTSLVDVLFQSPPLAGVEERIGEAVAVLGVLEERNLPSGKLGRGLSGIAIRRLRRMGARLAIVEDTEEGCAKHPEKAPETVALDKLEEVLDLLDRSMLAWKETLVSLMGVAEPSTLKKLGEPWKMPWGEVRAAYRSDLIVAMQTLCAREGFSFTQDELGAWLGAETVGETRVVAELSDSMYLSRYYSASGDYEGLTRKLAERVEAAEKASMAPSFRPEEEDAAPINLVARFVTDFKFIHAFDFDDSLFLADRRIVRRYERWLRFPKEHPETVALWNKREKDAAIGQTKIARPVVSNGGTVSRQEIQEHAERVGARLAALGEGGVRGKEPEHSTRRGGRSR